MWLVVVEEFCGLNSSEPPLELEEFRPTIRILDEEEADDEVVETDELVVDALFAVEEGEIGVRLGGGRLAVEESFLNWL